MLGNMTAAPGERTEEEVHHGCYVKLGAISLDI